MTSIGKLVLIGCGPGSADLLTFRAAQRIASADLLLVDRLVAREVIAHATPAARIVDVGKAPGDGGVQQAGINHLIRTALAEGHTVARLKSGDPMVFGRAAEELCEAVALGADIEIVPGVTAALAAASDAAISVTERAEIQSFSVVTARTADASTPDWVTLVRPGSCTAFYMGVAQAWRIQSTLMANGAPGSLAIEWVENAGRTDCRTISGTLSNLADTARRQRVRNPAILFVRYPLSAAASVGAVRISG